MRKSLLSGILSAMFAVGVAYASPVFAKTAPTQTARQSEVGFQLLHDTINKAPRDKAIYQGIRLANGMEVLLISDDQANKSLMSVALPIGSMDDPDSQQGLAHYLEHMILMGSKAFPETNSLDGFLTKNGGYNNAYTAADRTVYYLEVNHNAFDEAVARLSDAFAQPLLAEKNAKKELNAVNAEMVRAKSNDGFLIQAVGLATSNPHHPMTKFAVGNKTTLSDKPNSRLQAELENFYQQYYSANLMKAVLYGKQPIEQLAKLAERTLGKVKNKQLSVPTVATPLIRAEDSGVIIHYKPVKPNKMLAISFHVPPDIAQFKHKTNSYLGYVFENNSEGTLSDYLIKTGLSDSGIETSYEARLGRNAGEFSFYVSLTDKGFAQKEQIISLIFQQIEKIKQEGINPIYFNELKESKKQDFQHLQTAKSGHYIASLASRMIDYPLAHILDKNYVVGEMDVPAIQAKLALMTLENARILIVDPQAKTDQKTPYFEAPYAVAKITAAQKQQWLDFTQNPDLKLPELNPYFATDFSLNHQDHHRKKPQLLDKQAGTLIYAMPSHYFPQDPNVALLAAFKISPEVRDLKQGVSAVLLAYMADLAQAKLAFQASVAGIEFEPLLSENGIGLNVKGYAQHLTKFVGDLLTSFKQMPLTEADLAQGKQRYLEALDRVEKENAAAQANFALHHFARYPYFEQKDKREMVEKITLSDIQAMRTRLFHEATSFKLLSLGNFSDQQVMDLAERVQKQLENKNRELDYGHYVDISQSQRKLNYIKSIPHEDNAFTISYFPNGYNEIDGISRAALLKSILSRWYFDDLRTDKQLGYVVYATNTKMGKTAGLQFLVQSPTASPQTIMQHNQRFFHATLDKLKTMSPADFEKYRASLIEKLKYKPETLAQEFGELIDDFIRGNTQFDSTEQWIKRVETLTLAEIVEFYQKAVIDQQGFVFASQAIGTNSQINQAATLKGFERVESLQQLQGQFELKAY